MTTGGGDPSSKYTADTLLRAIAAAPDRPVDSAPTRVAHFRILERLGQGGMGVVYRAEDETLRRTVALKLLPDASGNEERRQRFLREARSAAAITHPNVAVVHQVGEADGRIYIAMELVEGENLRARLDRGRLGVETAREIAGQIARGLAAAHDKGIVHRDLKPENVMITPAGLVKLLDFGLAKPGVDRGPSSGPTEVGLAKTETVVTSDERRLMGTPEYMSPEQALGEALDVRSDVFSFGIVLYEMLAGARPFAGASTGAVLVAIARDAAPGLRERTPGLDEATEAIVARCLTKAPAERFANAGEIVSALGGQRTSGPTAQSRTDVEPVTRSGTMRARSRRSVVAVGIIAAAAGCALAWWVGPHARNRAAVDSSGASSLDSGAHRRGIAITDYPPPKTSVPEAAAAYARALQARRAGSFTLAGEELERATKLDPSFAAAQLRASMGAYAPTTASREHLATAEQHRDALDERDRMILKVAEANLAEPRSRDDVIALLRTLVQRFPDDAESSYLLAEELKGSHHGFAARLDEARDEYSRALSLDPDFASASLRWAATYWHNIRGGNDGQQALHLLARCLQVSPSAEACLLQRADLYDDQGECSKFEADARALTIVAPTVHTSYTFLAMALAAQQAPSEAVDEALHKRTMVAANADSPASLAQENSFATALLAGDLTAAEAEARRGLALIEGAQTEREHDKPMELLLDVIEERGDQVAALAEAESFERRASAWTQDAPWGVRMRLPYLRHRAGKIDGSALKSSLEAIHEKATARSSDDPAAYLLERGGALSTREQALDVLAELGEAGALDLSGYPDLAFDLGRTYLLAGRPADALAPLREAAQSCSVLTLWWGNTIWWMRSHVLLGQALEQTGDTPGACAAYAVVMDRWRNAKPRSITLEKAKERSRALACPKL